MEPPQNKRKIDAMVNTTEQQQRIEEHQRKRRALDQYTKLPAITQKPPINNTYIQTATQNAKLYLDTHDILLENRAYAAYYNDQDGQNAALLTSSICKNINREGRHIMQQFEQDLQALQVKKGAQMRATLFIYNSVCHAFRLWEMDRIHAAATATHCPPFYWQMIGHYYGMPRELPRAEDWLLVNDPYGAIKMFIEKAGSIGFHVTAHMEPVLRNVETGRYDPYTVFYLSCPGYGQRPEPLRL